MGEALGRRIAITWHGVMWGVWWHVLGCVQCMWLQLQPSHGIPRTLAGKLLDWILGEESALFKRRELKALVSMHAEPAVRRRLRGGEGQGEGMGQPWRRAGGCSQ